MSEPPANADGNPPPLVQTRGLTRVFQSRAGLFAKQRTLAAVSEVDLDIPRGRVTGVVGESGCGKSTLARLVLRLLDASSGSVHVDGTDLASLPPAGLRALRRRAGRYRPPRDGAARRAGDERNQWRRQEARRVVR